MSPEQVDVCIVGSGFGGSISAWRLAELYRAAGVDPARILVLERGRRFKHTEFKQSMYIGHLSDVYNLIQGSGGPGTVNATGPSGGQVVVANAVGGGSNLYLAASIRSPSEVFERRDHRPDDGEDRRMWPSAISRRTLNPFYARAEAGLRVKQPSWKQVSKSGGLWAATLRAAGHTCDRVPLAIDEGRCVNAKWCHTGCIFGAKNTLNTNYLASAERAGVRVRPNRQAESIRRSTTAGGYRYAVTASVMDNEGDNPTRQAKPGQSEEIECKVLILAAGAMGNPPLLMRSQPNLPSLSNQVGKHVGGNGDHIAGVEYDPAKIRSLLKLPGYGEFHKGKPITTMTYDFWVGRRDHRYDGTRFNLQEIFLSSLTNALYDDGRDPGGDPSWWGLQKKQSIATWNNHIELLAMVEDTHDGTFLAPPPNGGAVRPNAGPVTIAPFQYQLSDQSIAVRELANKAMRQIVQRNGLGRLMGVTETQGVYVAHPLGGCRMAESKDLGVVNDHCEVFDNEGLFCIDSSAIPTSLGVNPSLSIAAVSERAADALTARGQDLGLPARPHGFRHRTPGLYVGERVIPDRRHQAV
ncbi:MAG: FAD-dependent oxidoreductase [Gaiellaceae bacterium]